jgi:hypothetical protein
MEIERASMEPDRAERVRRADWARAHDVRPEMKGRARSTNKPQYAIIPGHSRRARRVRDIANALAERLGGWESISPEIAYDVRRAAELCVISEEARAAALQSGGSFDLRGLSHVEGAADRAIKRLRLDLRQPGQRGRPSIASMRGSALNELLAKVAAEKPQARPPVASAPEDGVEVGTGSEISPSSVPEPEGER